MSRPIPEFPPATPPAPLFTSEQRHKFHTEAARKLAESDDPVNREIGRDVLAGRITFREVMFSSAYADQIWPQVREQLEHFNSLSPEEQRAETACARTELLRLAGEEPRRSQP